MKTLNLTTVVESLEAQNENGQFDQVINELKVQLHNLQQAEEKANEEAELEIKEKWGLTIKEYDEVIRAFNSDDNPTDCAYKFNNKQLKLLAHKWGTDCVLYDVDGEFKTYDEAWDEVNNYPWDYIDIDEVINDNFSEVDEDEIYETLVELRDEEYATDENGNVVYEEDEVA